jgi:predicted nucleotidyltransferase
VTLHFLKDPVKRILIRNVRNIDCMTHILCVVFILIVHSICFQQENNAVARRKRGHEQFDCCLIPLCCPLNGGQICVTMNVMLTREDILTILRDNKVRFAEQYGVTKLGLFGSFARNEATEESDVDVCVEMPPDSDRMFYLREEIMEKTSRPVDLVRVRRWMDSLLKKRIKRDAVYV